MGEKGAKLTQKAAETCQQIVKVLASTGEITSRKMFGGYGIFESGVMFALVNSDGDLCLKANDSNVRRFEETGSKRHGKMPYYGVPDKVCKDHASLRGRAKASIAIAHSSKKKQDPASFELAYSLQLAPGSFIERALVPEDPMEYPLKFGISRSQQDKGVLLGAQTCYSCKKWSFTATINRYQSNGG